MIAIAGVIGAGLFVGSGAAIQAAGPGILVAYAAAGLVVILVMRMLGDGVRQSRDRVLLGLRRPGLRPLGRLQHRLALCLVLDRRPRR